MLLGDLLGSNHVATIAEAGLLFAAARDALVGGMIFWVLYMAFEPYLRRRWPATLVSWSRVLLGRVRDPLVGRDLLVGLALGSIGTFLVRALPTPFVVTLAPQLMPSLGGFASLWCSVAITAVGGALSYAFVLNLLMLVLRQRWLALGVFVLALTALLAPGHGGGSLLIAARPAFLFTLVGYTLMTFGLLATIHLIR